MPDKGPREGSQSEGKGRVYSCNYITVKDSINAYFSLFLLLSSLFFIHVSLLSTPWRRWLKAAGLSTSPGSPAKRQCSSGSQVKSWAQLRSSPPMGTWVLGPACQGLGHLDCPPCSGQRHEGVGASHWAECLAPAQHSSESGMR